MAEPEMSRRNKRKEQKRAAKRAFTERALRRTVDQFIFGDMRSRAAYLVGGLTWSVRRLTWAMSSYLHPARPAISSQKKVTIAVVTGGGLGDVLSTSKYLEQLYIATGHALIDVFYAHESYLRFLLKRVPYVSRLFPESALADLRWNYDAIVEVHRLVRYDIVNADRISRFCPELFWLRNISDRRNGEYSVHLREMPQLDGDLAKRAVLRGMNRKSLLGYSGAVDIGRDDWIFISPAYKALQIFKRADLKPGHYVTLHDGFDTAHRFPSRSTKQWPLGHWRRLIAELRSAHPELKIVQVGGRNSVAYEGLNVDLVGKATFDEVAWLLKYSVCHIDTESGLVRLAREVGGKSIVIFGPTDPDFFSFSENVNLKANKCGNCFWSTPDWLMTCPKGLDEPECTASIRPEQVLAALEIVINEHKRLGRRVAVAEYVQVSNDKSSTECRGLDPTPRNIPTETSVGCIPLRAAVDIRGQLPGITALIRSRIRGRTAKVALIAPQGDGCEIERHLTTMNGAHTTRFLIQNNNEEKNSMLAAPHSEFFRPKMERPGDGTGEPALHYASAFNVPVSRNTFDFVVLAYDLDYQIESGFALREMLRVLKRDGTLIWLLQRNRETSDKGSTVDLLDPKRLKSMFDEHDVVLERNIAAPPTITGQLALVVDLLPNI